MKTREEKQTEKIIYDLKKRNLALKEINQQLMMQVQHYRAILNLHNYDIGTDPPYEHKASGFIINGKVVYDETK